MHAINYRSFEGEGKIKGFFDVVTLEGILIKGFKVVEGTNGHFVSNPSVYSNKDDKWNDVTYIPSAIKEMIYFSLLILIGGRDLKFKFNHTLWDRLTQTINGKNFTDVFSKEFFSSFLKNKFAGLKEIKKDEFCNDLRNHGAENWSRFMAEGIFCNIINIIDKNKYIIGCGFFDSWREKGTGWEYYLEFSESDTTILKAGEYFCKEALRWVAWDGQVIYTTSSIPEPYTGLKVERFFANNPLSC